MIVGFVIQGKSIDNEAPVYFTTSINAGGYWSTTFKDAEIIYDLVKAKNYSFDWYHLDKVSEISVMALTKEDIYQFNMDSFPSVKKKTLINSALSKLTKEEIEALGI